MKKSNFKSCRSCGQLLPLPAESRDGRFWPCHSPETQIVLWGIPMTLSPWGSLFGALPPWHCCLSRAVTWVTLNHTKPPEKGLLCSCIQPVFLWGLGPAHNVIPRSVLFCVEPAAVYGRSLAQFCPAAVSSGTGTLSLAHFFSVQWQQTLNVLRTWKGHRILADDLIDHTPHSLCVEYTFTLNMLLTGNIFRSTFSVPL